MRLLRAQQHPTLLLLQWLSAVTLVASAFEAAPEISLVLEPFEADLGFHYEHTNNNNANDLNNNANDVDNNEANNIIAADRGGDGASTINDSGHLPMKHAVSDSALFGNGALHVLYSYRAENYPQKVSLTLPDDQASFNCLGATKFSLWYRQGAKNNESLNVGNTTSDGNIDASSAPFTSQSNLKLRLSFLDDRNCLKSQGCNSSSTASTNSLEWYDSPFVSLTKQHDQQEWQDVVFSPESFVLRGSGDGVVNDLFNSNTNGVFDLGHIRSWSLEVFQDVPDISEMSTPFGYYAPISFDQLSCKGPGDDLMNAHFRAPPSFPSALDELVWETEVYDSDLSHNQTNVTLQNGSLHLDYLLQHTAEWGGFYLLFTNIPGNAYLNLSQAADLALNYTVTEVASVPGRVHVRLILSDSSDCGLNCRDDAVEINTEKYYSFLNVLDDGNDTATNTTAGEQPQQQHVAELSGDSMGVGVGFRRTGWAGVVGNDRMDREYIKGFAFELNINMGGMPDSIVTGGITLHGLTAGHQTLEDPASDGSIVIEPEIFFEFRNRTYSPNVTEFFAGAECRRLCAEDDSCYYGYHDVQDCFTATKSVSTDNLQLFTTRARKERITAFWKRSGLLCDMCDCDELQLEVDCRGKNLTTFPEVKDDAVMMWSPVSLDLRENPGLIMLGQSAFTEFFAKNLRNLWLPMNLVYIHESNFEKLPETSKIVPEEPDNGQSLGRNFIQGPQDNFKEVCCSLGNEFGSAEDKVTFCNMTVRDPGFDATYVPFAFFRHSESVIVLTRTATFMSEAAESPQKCAEYCSIWEDCNFFAHDNRNGLSAPICHFYQNDPRPLVWYSDAYADDAETIPGYVSGWTAKTRRQEENAKVILSDHEITADPSSGFSAHYSVSLGAAPKLGAVWVIPRSVSNKHDLVFSPPKIALYDNLTMGTFTVSVANPDNWSAGSAATIINQVESCDIAFQMQDDNGDSSSVVEMSIIVSAQYAARPSTTIISTVGASILILAIFAFWWHVRKSHEIDSLWSVDIKDLNFGTPPEIAGRGTFGLVLLAEYRGTQVAVKRVIPPRCCSLKKRASDLATTQNAENMALADDFTDSEVGADVMRLAKESTGGNFFQMVEYKRLKADFVKEMRMLSKLRHPCVTTVMGAVVSRTEEPMLVMEYMDHGSLYDLLHNNTVMIEGELVLPILRDITQGVRFLHAASPQVIHGDLKAQNILVDSKFRAKVTDFGFSQKKRLDIMGTPFWMAPELLRGQVENNTATDIYAFGMILYEVYSRKDPYEDESADDVEILKHIANPDVNKRPEVPEFMPETVQGLMIQCLRGDPTTRPEIEVLDRKFKALESSVFDPKPDGSASVSPKPDDSASVSAQSSDEAKSHLMRSFPEHVAEALIENRKVEPESRDCVTILFCQIADFTEVSTTLPPLELSDLLNRLYSRIDQATTTYDVYKMETISDSYMAVTNLVKDQDDHAARIAKFALHVMEASKDIYIDTKDRSRGHVHLSIGFHSGPAVANVVGLRNPRYCLFGDAVNTASQMQASCEPGRIHCSERTAMLLQVQDPSVKIFRRGEIAIKGKGVIRTFWVGKGNGRQTPLPPATERRVNSVKSRWDP